MLPVPTAWSIATPTRTGTSASPAWWQQNSTEARVRRPRNVRIESRSTPEPDVGLPGVAARGSVGDPVMRRG